MSKPFEVDFKLLINSPANHKRVRGAACWRCGLVYLQNEAPHEAWRGELRDLE